MQRTTTVTQEEQCGLVSAGVSLSFRIFLASASFAVPPDSAFRSWWPPLAPRTCAKMLWAPTPTSSPKLLLLERKGAGSNIGKDRVRSFDVGSCILSTWDLQPLAIFLKSLGAECPSPKRVNLSNYGRIIEGPKRIKVTYSATKNKGLGDFFKGLSR